MLPGVGGKKAETMLVRSQQSLIRSQRINKKCRRQRKKGAPEVPLLKHLNILGSSRTVCATYSRDTATAILKAAALEASGM